MSQNTEWTNLKPILGTCSIPAVKTMYMTLTITLFKKGDIFSQNIFAFCVLLITWSLTMQNIKTFLQIFIKT